MSSRLVRMIHCVFVALVGLHCVTQVHAAPGDLDVSFGDFGRRIFSIPNTSTVAYDMLRQDDGKILAVGSSGAQGTRDFLVARFTGEGAVDTSFGTNGAVSIDFSGFDDSAMGVVPQAGGKLLVIGTTQKDPTNFRTVGVVRLNSDGSVDSTFGIGGKSALTILFTPTGIAVQPDGNILVAGATFSVVRLIASTGALDPTFGSSGVASVSVGTPYVISTTSGPLIQADGKIVTFGGVGLGFSTTVMNSAVARYTSAGMPDPTFNGGPLGTGNVSAGLILTPCSGLGLCSWFSGVQQTDGKLVMGGYTGGTVVTAPAPLIQQNSMLQRLNSDGGVDLTFGNSGRVTGVFSGAYYGQALQSGEFVRRISLSGDGGIVVSGSTIARNYNSVGTIVPTLWDLVVTRITSGGTVDRTFGKQGFSVVDLSSGAQGAGASLAGAALLPDESMLVMATRTLGSSTDVAVAKLSNGNSNGGVIRVVGGSTSVAETAGNAVFRVRRTGGASGAVSVAYNTVAETANANSDYTPVNGVLTWGDGEYSEKVVPVPIVADATVEDTDKSFQLQISNVSGGARIDGDRVSVVIARDDIAPTMGFSLTQSSAWVNEGQGGVTLTVNRLGTSTTAASVNYFTLPGTAGSSDYTTVNGVLEWGAGDATPKTIVVPITNDVSGESSETFSLILMNTTGVVLGNGMTTVTVADDDVPNQVSFATNIVSVSESQASIVLNVVRSGSNALPITANYATSAGTASASSDFATTSGTLTWLPTDPDSKTITILLTNDATYEGNETFIVTLSSPTSSATLGTATITVTIADDEVAPPPPNFGNDVVGGGSAGGGGGGGVDSSLLAFMMGLSLLQRAVRRRSSRR